MKLNPNYAIEKMSYLGCLISNAWKTNIIPQDFGRVLLNLYNNAFYAVKERSRRTVASTSLPTGQAGSAGRHMNQPFQSQQGNRRIM